MDISPPPSTTVTTAATTVKTPDPESEPPKQQLIPPPFTNGVLKRHKPFNHHQLSPPIVVTYKECLKNHAATMGGHAVDGCGEFMPSPSSSPSIPTSLKCAACGCHRNFHRRDHEHPPSPPPIQHLLEYQPHHRHQPPPPPPLTATTSPLNSPSPPPISSSYYPSSAPHMLLALGSETNNHNHYSSPMSGKKRFRTKFTQAQKEKMHEIASKVGWKMQKRDEDLINGFCNEIGVDRNVFKVWMHNNKSTTTNKNNNNDDHGHGNNIINVNNINSHDAIDFIMSRNINNSNVSHNDDVINNNNDNHDLHLDKELLVLNVVVNHLEAPHHLHCVNQITILVVGAKAWGLEQLTECRKYLKGQGIFSRMVLFLTVLIGSKRMMMFDFIFVAARMILLLYVVVAFVYEVLMFKYGFDAAQVTLLLYVAVLLGFEFRMFEWGFDVALFSFVVMLWICKMLLRLHKLKPKPKPVVGRISMIAQITRITASREWYLDSGATIHVVGSRNSFTTCRAVIGRKVKMANRDKADVCGVGTVQMKFTYGKTATLHNVLHVPTISKSLVSVGKLDEHGFKIAIESRKVVITKRGLLWEKDTTKKGCID
uniref:ZF-HD dimerization-type domain-containing protein n=1 Tax=Tanacetum cinerariifolium TaxID=118510 RepID=A0A699GQT2_TANCI|nr:hypothetical protein [Tanacetum cinerariifolium]GEV80622.1 hypothetical protein [Tanacetum cinerariifolium]